MLQILCFVLGAYALIQSEIKISNTRILKGQDAKILGGILLGGGVLSLFLGPLVVLATVIIAIGYGYMQTQGSAA
ncbi:MAG TPA: hypothetical protein VHL11_06315 [Phototrophicaceae bacterium]|jgi:hypothetical protein|nr:hypothetical protein [Phototrophicaceae bacterium]